MRVAPNLRVMILSTLTSESPVQLDHAIRSIKTVMETVSGTGTGVPSRFSAARDQDQNLPEGLSARLGLL